MTSIAQLRLWQLISPALPIGSFAYSTGLEYAVHAGWVSDEQQTLAWIKGQLTHNLSRLDVPVLCRLYQAWQMDDIAAVKYWDGWLLAAREAKELHLEDTQLGQALQRVLSGQQITLPVDEPDREWSFITVLAFAAVYWQIPLEDVASGLLWMWSENQVAAAIKLVPLGQTAGQRVLSAVLQVIPQAVSQAIECRDDEIGMSAPGLGIASAQHELQYSRLFRS